MQCPNPDGYCCECSMKEECDKEVNESENRLREKLRKAQEQIK